MTNTPIKKEIPIVTIFNYLGGIIVFIGISYFIVDNWGMLNNFTKIFATLGAAIAAFIIGSLLQATHQYPAMSSSFYLLSALLLPVGLQVTLHLSNIALRAESLNVLISAISLSVFLIAQSFSKRNIFLIFTIVFASLFYLSIINFITYKANYDYTYLLNYELIILGISYLFLGYHLDKNHKRNLVGALYFIGSFFVLSQSLSLGNMQLLGHTIPLWEVISPIVIILTFILSIPLRSKSLLFIGAFFMLIYIFQIASKFIIIFGEIGWSLILILFGLLLMSIGHIVLFTYKKINRTKLD